MGELLQFRPRENAVTSRPKLSGEMMYLVVSDPVVQSFQSWRDSNPDIESETINFFVMDNARYVSSKYGLSAEDAKMIINRSSTDTWQGGVEELNAD